MSQHAEALMDEFVLPRAIVRRRPGTEPDELKGAVKASWVSGNNVYTVTELEEEAPHDLPYLPFAVSDQWTHEFDPGSRLLGTQNHYLKYKRVEDCEVLAARDFLRAKKPSFSFMDILYASPQCSRMYVITRIHQHLRNLPDALDSLITRDAEGRVVDDDIENGISRVLEACDKVAGQTADAYVEMSAWKGERYGSIVEGFNLKDPNFRDYSDLTIDGVSHDEVVRKCQEAGIECTTPIFTISHAGGPGGILVDENLDFVGFTEVHSPGFVPRDWLHVKYFDRESSGLELYSNGTLLWVG